MLCYNVGTYLLGIKKCGAAFRNYTGLTIEIMVCGPTFYKLTCGARQENMWGPLLAIVLCWAHPLQFATWGSPLEFWYMGPSFINHGMCSPVFL